MRGFKKEALARKLKAKSKAPHLKPLPLFKGFEDKDEEQSPARKKTPRISRSRSTRVSSHPALDEIKTLKIDEMTPLEALNRLQQIKEKITSSSSSTSGGSV